MRTSATFVGRRVGSRVLVSRGSAKPRRAGRLAAAVAGLMLVACTAGDNGPEGEPDEGSTDDGNGDRLADHAAAPGVTDDSIRVGITYVALEAVAEFVDVDHGDYEATYRALIDEINAGGGIHGRTIEPVFAAVDPIGTASAEEVCLQLTEDEAVFAVMGFFLEDEVLCYVDGHSTATIGGVVSEDRYARASAPWFTTEGSDGTDTEAIRAMAEAGDLDGNLAVFGSILSEAQTNDVVLPLLEELGVEPVDTAILDAPEDDSAAQNQGMTVIAERFRSQDVDRVLVVGSAAVPMARGLAGSDYRPELLFTSRFAVEGYTNGLDPDLSMFEGAVLGSIDNEIFDEPGMQDCLATLEEAGIGGISDPADLDPGEPTPFVSASMACRNVALFAALAEAAGPDLDHGSFHEAGAQLGELELPGAEDVYNYGAFPAVDGDLPIHLFDWDSDDAEFVRRESGS